MKYKVRFSPFAKEDRNTIKAYLSKFYPGTPSRFNALLREHIEILKDNPFIYPVYCHPLDACHLLDACHPKDALEDTDYRRMFVGNYVVFYKVNDAEKQIDIYRILRASWDLPRYL